MRQLIFSDRGTRMLTFIIYRMTSTRDKTYTVSEATYMKPHTYQFGKQYKKEKVRTDLCWEKKHEIK